MKIPIKQILMESGIADDLVNNLSNHSLVASNAYNELANRGLTSGEAQGLKYSIQNHPQYNSLDDNDKNYVNNVNPNIPDTYSNLPYKMNMVDNAENLSNFQQKLKSRFSGIQENTNPTILATFSDKGFDKKFGFPVNKPMDDYIKSHPAVYNYFASRQPGNEIYINSHGANNEMNQVYNWHFKGQNIPTQNQIWFHDTGFGDFIGLDKSNNKILKYDHEMGHIIHPETNEVIYKENNKQ